MASARSVVFVAVLGYLVGELDASAGDINPLYRSCVEQCQKSGNILGISLLNCQLPPESTATEGPWYMQEPVYLRWKQLSCLSDCRYHCMVKIEKERGEAGHAPVKYHGKWPFKRVLGLQEPVSAAFSLLNLIMHLFGWISFCRMVSNLPLRPQNKRTYYEYTGLWHIYGFLAINAWFWSAIFHSRDLDLTEKSDYSAAVALLGYSLILSILRTFNIRDEASRVMISTPLLAFITTHILYLNFYKLDYGLNMKVCLGMGVLQLLLWAGWAGATSHPSRFKLWTVVFGGGLALLLEIYDFPPYEEYIDAHALWHATTVPLTLIWWSFVKDDATFRTSALVNKAK